MNETASLTPDSQHKGLVALLPASARPYALLGRFDRPIGWWLLFWPCVAGLWAGGALERWGMALLLLVGAIAMRAAGCVYNDILDRDLDRKVARTASRPLASGQVSLKKAWIWLLSLCLVGLVVLLQLRWEAQLVALGSILPVALYPLMKRITWWPQAWLGLVFSWGALVGWVEATGEFSPVLAAMYGGCIFWVIGYDTIYAVQDMEDDALVGVRSSALAMGSHVKAGVALCYALALTGWGLGIWWLRPDWIALLTLVPVGLHLAWQVATLDRADGAGALARFRSNRLAGLLMALAWLVVGNAG
ncbi:4-hydroxybenzoate octaprenyltransferase [Croceicoccus mobilis]|uniref:4-hydroxybenzoate octaprenyltransferase n=1 Tax=Croceicoccus mobilis TaxID=1703339 RepID=A0A917DTG0_9SPHN|nr:4-hydroxybenzoate octaprenyltransferase [Croceicoccus mobilis]GGD68737.1 4-hydroxybenzoate octaprenyltransferase [Croceicoccus mobilis]